ncbi:FAD:protein FMN transferase [Paludibaculum fermentans]|uniref:FAD:protein FMN transferase n=1 Tax=Paludibaculum fermentans TaxID=1473598 RepID=A0A7S7NRI0_PALFE|nr:FAD:protein FMN transferase [Paludibaculum fermentans]QOY87974.1 FAD:protein FMN transferase [Paludibaculum fermentans]
MACEFSTLFPGRTTHAVDAGCAALDEVDRLEDLLSIYRDDSEMSRLNRCRSNEYTTVPEVYEVIRLAAGLWAETGGGFDMAVAPLVRIWGFFRGPRRVPSDAEIEQALALCGSRHLYFPKTEWTLGFRRPGIEFNPGAIGKGYAIDRAIRLMWNHFGIRCALMQAGQSSLYGLGAPAGAPRGWNVDIGDPFGSTRPLARVYLRNRGLGTSGAANQYFEVNGLRYGHILDPRTGRPAGQLASATAVARSSAEADALSTAFFVMGTEWVRSFCETHRAIGAVLVPLKTDKPARGPIVLGAADVEVSA